MADTERPHCPLWARVIATGFGSGLSPVAPGTIGSLAALLVLWGLKLYAQTPLPNFRQMHETLFMASANSLPYWPIILVIVYCVIGIPAAGLYARTSGLHDPKQVVIDEFAGQTLAFVPISLYDGYHGHGYMCMPWLNWLLLFALFRLFDIWKPWLIKRLEYFPRGWGIMLDDLAAGLVAGIVFLASWKFFPVFPGSLCPP